MLAPQKVTKEEGTQPSRPSASLRCSPKQALAKLNLAAHTKRELLRSSDSHSLLSYLVSATQRDGMGSVSPNSQRRSLDVSNHTFCYSVRTSWHSWFFGPLSAAPSSAGKIRSSERLFESRGGLRFVQAARMSSASAYFGEQRRNQAEARVSCSLPSFLWTSIRKNGRLKAK